MSDAIPSKQKKISVGTDIVLPLSTGLAAGSMAGAMYGLPMMMGAAGVAWGVIYGAFHITRYRPERLMRAVYATSAALGILAGSQVGECVRTMRSEAGEMPQAPVSAPVAPMGTEGEKLQKQESAPSEEKKPEPQKEKPTKHGEMMMC